MRGVSSEEVILIINLPVFVKLVVDVISSVAHSPISLIVTLHGLLHVATIVAEVTTARDASLKSAAIASTRRHILLTTDFDLNLELMTVITRHAGDTAAGAAQWDGWARTATYDSFGATLMTDSLALCLSCTVALSSGRRVVAVVTGLGAVDRRLVAQCPTGRVSSVIRSALGPVTVLWRHLDFCEMSKCSRVDVAELSVMCPVTVVVC